jgi:hypothetical protein
VATPVVAVKLLAVAAKVENDPSACAGSNHDDTMLQNAFDCRS